ncbi:DUF1801 domain-containing protein [Rhodohalobacter sp. SW132]|uniref:DUF1801 domain-containing protein n=1 Tax=Rhodohalobacter sp. SW132 TaxID=2293433 RepID=UPI000E21FB00|nr:DUF1801 domain-containing protein [Rhodohalobacter sp. SW132]REL38442.1 DUF1801 domain-containing protein [Rhodohalobacter sp. SW132]
MDSEVAQKFDSYPDYIKPKMQNLRDLIFEVAETTDGVGKLNETLKWGEPAYLPSKKKTGTTIRIDWKSKSPEQVGMYVSCNTTLIDTFRTMFGDDLSFEGKRAVVFPVNEPIPRKELMICIRMALRYHLDKRE